ncbi:hypothetical protein E3Q22_02426 [Wallemia mellicola]|uniref:LysM domain-containing protein n=1 Tax=Wallemia mellicola TaxID=1708541 RepID=A0A4T0QXD4_9BASI|nr:hypothetical protein E3Q23_01358 [Wallemia mellicola]TIB78909.1 hypothetical protein E3Q22_02426 [Wallemia mellicola]TIB89677.1 hypothetical protein E3Q19_02995 [Wallemia mellicola]TIB96684.1 hypothetical protein E3Q18_02998 [Wallemia mellicola]TIC05846.1 hypothetical protein E3Q16_01707 [Wallemia mellicola]
MSGRYTYFDSDDYRLPEGMKRVGYDSDTQQYTFRDNEVIILLYGYYIGQPGAEYGGRLTYTGPLTGNERDDDSEFIAPPINAPNSPYRPLLPFFVIVAVILLLLVKFIYSGNTSICPDDLIEYKISRGDTCWDISQTHSVALDWLQEKYNCDKLIPGTRMCLPRHN